MIKKRLAFLMTFLIIFTTMGIPVYGELKPSIENNELDLINEEDIYKSLDSDELNAYQKSLNGITDDPDFDKFSIESDINTSVESDNQYIELIERKCEVTSILQSEIEGIKNYEAFVFKKDTFKINQIDNEKTLRGISSEEDWDSTYSVYYLIKFEYDSMSSPISAIRPNSSQIKIISTDSGVNVNNAQIVQRVWGVVYDTDLGTTHSSESYSRDIDISTPITGNNYSRFFNSPRNYYYDEIAAGQCGFGVILTLQRSDSSRSWEYSTGFLGINNSPGW
jgi:hypothetical protein